MRCASCKTLRPSAFAEATRAQEAGPWHWKMVSALTYPPYLRSPSTQAHSFIFLVQLAKYKATNSRFVRGPADRTAAHTIARHGFSPPVRVDSGIYDGPTELNQQSVQSTLLGDRTGHAAPCQVFALWEESAGATA